LAHQLRHVGRNPPRHVFDEQFYNAVGSRMPGRLGFANSRNYYDEERIRTVSEASGSLATFTSVILP
jgi:hypothetical protein